MGGYLRIAYVLASRFGIKLNAGLSQDIRRLIVLMMNALEFHSFLTRSTLFSRIGLLASSSVTYYRRSNAVKALTFFVHIRKQFESEPSIDSVEFIPGAIWEKFDYRGVSGSADMAVSYCISNLERLASWSIVPKMSLLKKGYFNPVVAHVGDFLSGPIVPTWIYGLQFLIDDMEKHRPIHTRNYGRDLSFGFFLALIETSSLDRADELRGPATRYVNLWIEVVDILKTKAVPSDIDKANWNAGSVKWDASMYVTLDPYVSRLEEHMRELEEIKSRYTHYS